MPNLNESVIKNLAVLLQQRLATLGQTSQPVCIGAGGSAAVFTVNGPLSDRAFKVYDPKFLEGESGPAERRRLELQRKLIGHQCPYLIEVYSVEEANGTAFVEMGLCDWPQLSKRLGQVPDPEVHSLVCQLVAAVRFLEDLNIVHRDIKPENIHISPDFKTIKVLDLGVARVFDEDNSTDSATDRNNLRLFVATAQYSSPEYLFRLDEPTPRLWKGLNVYQVGAVLHDLIMKTALFEDEANRGNRWLIARAVLTKTPSFADANQDRLAALKALSARCLTKDLETRLQIVDWSDFATEGSQDPLLNLKARLERRETRSSDASPASSVSRLRFDQKTFQEGLIQRVRSELISSCGTQLPFIVTPPVPDCEPIFRFQFRHSDKVTITSLVRIEWLTEIYNHTAVIRIGDVSICAVTISEAEDQAVHCVSCALAKLVGEALDLIQGNNTDGLQAETPVCGNMALVEVR